MRPVSIVLSTCGICVSSEAQRLTTEDREQKAGGTKSEGRKPEHGRASLAQFDDGWTMQRFFAEEPRVLNCEQYRSLTRQVGVLIPGPSFAKSSVSSMVKISVSPAV
jgi:hypothetical protein